jgi:hypothetical protein
LVEEIRGDEKRGNLGGKRRGPWGKGKHCIVVYQTPKKSNEENTSMPDLT